MDLDAVSAERDTVQETIRVILVDDHELARHGVRKLLGSDVGIEVVGEAESCWEAISLIARLRPEVAILDIRLREGNGIEVGRAARRLSPNTKVLVLSAYDDSQYVVSMVKLGVSGYLTKTASGEDLIRAVHYAARGWLVFSPDIADKMAGLLGVNGGFLVNEANGDDGYGDGGRQRSSRGLTAREAEVLQHMFRGLRNRDIASVMGISPKTVEIHIHRILLKLGAKNRSQALVNSLGSGYLQGMAVPAGPTEIAPCGPSVSRNVGLSTESAS